MFGLTLWPVIKPYLEKYHDDPDWIEACRIRFQEGEQTHGVVSHTIYHYALVAVFLRALGVEPPSDIGVAPSTLRHWETASAR